MSDEPKRGFHCSHRAYYAKGAGIDNPEIMIGHYFGDGTTKGEFAIRWTPVCGCMVPRLEVFNDAWHLLPVMVDLLTEMAKAPKGVDDKAMRDILLALGFEDMTAYQPSSESSK